jgi:hypothetical protein
MARYSFLAIPYNKVGFLKKNPSYAQTIKNHYREDLEPRKNPQIVNTVNGKLEPSQEISFFLLEPVCAASMEVEGGRKAGVWAYQLLQSPFMDQSESSNDVSSV